MSKGLKVDLQNKVSVINKKIDIFLPKKYGFTRSNFFAAMKPLLKSKRKNLENHVIQVDRIRTNGEGTECSTSNIFGKPLVRILTALVPCENVACSAAISLSVLLHLCCCQALHITVLERLGVALDEKLVLRCYKECAEANGKQSSNGKVAYLVQVNAGVTVKQI